MVPIARMGGLRRKAPPGDLGTKSKSRTRPCPPPLWMSVGNSLCGLLGVSAIRVFLERRFVQSLSQSRIAFQAMPLFRVQIAVFHVGNEGEVHTTLTHAGDCHINLTVVKSQQRLFQVTSASLGLKCRCGFPEIPGVGVSLYRRKMQCVGQVGE